MGLTIGRKLFVGINNPRNGALLNQVPVEYTDFIARVEADSGTVYAGADSTNLYLIDAIKNFKNTGLWEDALLVMIPSAVNSGKLYCVKGKDFTFTRNLEKWVVNASNILFSSAANVPALRYDKGRERWEFDKENAASTLIVGSLAQDNMLYSMLKLTRGTNTDDSPFGAGTADRGTEDSTTGNHFYYGGWTRVSGNKYTMSFVVKLSGRTHVDLNYTADGQCRCLFDLVNLTATPSGGLAVTGGIEAYGDGYRRIWMTFTAASNAVAGASSTNLYLHNGTATSYAGDGESYIVRAHHNLVIGDVSSPMVAGAGNVTRPEDIATATGVINTSNPYTLCYQIDSHAYVDVFKDGDRIRYIDGVLDSTTAVEPSADITLSTIGRWGNIYAFGRELSISEMGFFLSNNVGIDTETISIDNANTSIDLT